MNNGLFLPWIAACRQVPIQGKKTDIYEARPFQPRIGTMPAGPLRRGVSVPNTLFSLEEVAAICRVQPAAVERWATDGRLIIAAFASSGRPLFHAADVLALGATLAAGENVRRLPVAPIKPGDPRLPKSRGFLPPAA